jgi:LysR family carnitine catabolism transcriptional activator
MEINLSTRDLRAFLAVATSLSFSKAAKEMHLSQSALSTLVVRLEATMGSRLFDRTTRAVALTAAGAVLASHAGQLLSELERTVIAVHDVAAVRRGQVALAAMPSLAARIVPRLFRAFGARYPDVRLSLVDTLSEPAFELVREGRVDFALTAANPAYTDLDYAPLTTDSFVLLAARARWDARAARCVSPTRCPRRTSRCPVTPACASTSKRRRCRTGLPSIPPTRLTIWRR